MTEARDPYEVLGVPRNATQRQIRAAYVARARRAHPDLVGARGLDVMRGLNAAWALLKDDSHRAAWDRGNRPIGGSVGDARSDAVEPDGERPFWTGAMGPPPGRPSGPVLHFGIFDRWSIGEVARRDPGYLLWLRDRPEGGPFRAEIVRLLDPDPAGSGSSRAGRRR